jgi:hypothetical protein
VRVGKVAGATWCAAWLACAGASQANAQVRTVANLVVGDAVIVVQASPDKQVYIGVGTDTRTSTVTASATAVDEFVGESEAIVRLGAQPIPKHTIDRPVLQEGATGRSLSLSRLTERQHGVSVVTYHFYVSDARLAGYVVPATPAEAKAVLLALHRAARAAVPAHAKQ